MDFDYSRPALLPTAVHEDVRGAHSKIFGLIPSSLALSFTVDECFFTTGHRNVIRGMHFQRPGQTKIITCVAGAVAGNVLCCDPNLPEYGTAMEFTMKNNDGQRLYVPGSWAPGYRSLQNNTRMLYLAEGAFVPAGDVGVHPLDPGLNLAWGADFNPAEAILSPRDQNLPTFEEAMEKR